jgi:hypothetical protein
MQQDKIGGRQTACCCRYHGKQNALRVTSAIDVEPDREEYLRNPHEGRSCRASDAFPRLVQLRHGPGDQPPADPVDWRGSPAPHRVPPGLLLWHGIGIAGLV